MLRTLRRVSAHVVDSQSDEDAKPPIAAPAAISIADNKPAASGTNSISSTQYSIENDMNDSTNISRKQHLENSDNSTNVFKSNINNVCGSQETLTKISIAENRTCISSIDKHCSDLKYNNSSEFSENGLNKNKLQSSVISMPTPKCENSDVTVCKSMTGSNTDYGIEDMSEDEDESILDVLTKDLDQISSEFTAEQQHDAEDEQLDCVSDDELPEHRTNNLESIDSSEDEDVEERLHFDR